MATGGWNSDHGPEFGAASSQQEERGSPARDARDASHGPRRRSSTYGHSVRQNVHSFHRNRASRVRRADETSSTWHAYRARARNLARTTAEHQRPSDQTNGLDANPPAAKWQPSIAIGSPLWLEGEDLSAIEIADRKVAQRRLWADHYQGVPDFVRMLDDAIRERGQMDETAEENTRPRSAVNSVRHAAVQQRLEHLRILLGDSTFPPERANIEAAISGYESGAIPCSDSYTLIWAGNIVDRCPDFDSFTTDRGTRLDRYHAIYGPGWLWHEPPLAGGGGAIVRRPTVLAQRGICLENKQTWRRGTENMGHYRVRMGFRRRKETVTRGEAAPVRGARNPRLRRRSSVSDFTSPLTPTTPNHHQNHHHHQQQQQQQQSKPITSPDPDGPRIFFDTLLDSGATLPCLFESDMSALRINPATYAAQSSRMIATADSLTHLRVYELDVGVYDAPTTPEQPRSVSGGGDTEGEEQDDEDEEEAALTFRTVTLPVVAFAGQSHDSIGSSRHPDAAPDRLSGLLPFHACYVSGAPGHFQLWLGEERRDVLGAARLPGQMRFGEKVKVGGLSARREEEEQWWQAQRPRLGAPKRVVFEHELADGTGRVVRDEEVAGGTVIMRGPGGTEFDYQGIEEDGEKKKKKPAVAGIEVVRIERRRRVGGGGGAQQRRRSVVKKAARQKVKRETGGEGLR